jgi:hypothetical protein
MTKEDGFFFTREVLVANAMSLFQLLDGCLYFTSAFVALDFGLILLFYSICLRR